MAADLQLSIENGERLRALVRDLRRWEDGKELRKRLRRELKGTGGRIVRAEKAAVRALPSKGQNARLGRPSTRREIARATQLRIRTNGPRAGVMVWVNPKRMPPGKGAVPGFMEGIRPYQRWRHPVFGRDAWTTQRAHPWFYRTAGRYGGEAQRAAERVIDGIAREIESRG
jgi:hypothetical protein